jgi:hypothetical protein
MASHGIHGVGAIVGMGRSFEMANHGIHGAGVAIVGMGKVVRDG